MSDFGSLPPSPLRALYRYRGWRRLRSMRTALYLLAVLALAAVVAGLVPQRPNVPDTAAQWSREHPLGRVFEALGLFDVYGSVWFRGVLVALVVVLLACLVPRTTALLRHRRQLRRAPAVGPFPGTGRRTALETALPPDAALRVARHVLRRKGFRLSKVNDSRQFVGERGFAREAGSLLFHWSMLLLVTGAAVSQGFGFRGQAIIVEGERWTDDVASYSFYQPGRFYRDSWHKGFVVHLDDFDVRYDLETGAPEDFVSRVRILEDGAPVKEKDIRVNDPLVHAGLKFFQASYGWAPVVRVAQAGEPLYEGPVVSFQDRPFDPWVGVVRLATLEPDMALKLYFYPDPKFFTGSGAAPVEPKQGAPPILNLSDIEGGSAGGLGAPVLVADAFRFDLQATRPQNVFTLDTTGHEPIARILLVPPEIVAAAGAAAGGTLSSSDTVPGDVEVELLGLRRYTVLQVKADPGIPLVAVAGGLILVGLVPSLVAWRRRMWVSVGEGAGDGSLIELGGVAYQRKERFDEEFTALALRLRNHLPPVVPERSPVG